MEPSDPGTAGVTPPPGRGASTPSLVPRGRDARRAGGDGWTRALGALSAALGTPPLVLTGPFCRLAGVGGGSGERAVVRAVGARELAVAAGLLARPHRGWLWARVAGDAMDLTLLGRSLVARSGTGHAGTARTRTLAVTAAVAAVTLLDVAAAVVSRADGGPVEATASVTVRRPRAEVYEFWRRLDNLPRFMVHLDAVEVIDGRRSRWAATAPFGRTVEWDAEVVDEQPGERLHWASTEGAAVRNEGAVVLRDAPGGRGTEVRVTVRYEPPAGDLGRAVARYFGEEPVQQLDDDLRRLKQVLETGEVVRSDGSPEGARARRQFPQHPARPLTPQEISRGVRA